MITSTNSNTNASTIYFPHWCVFNWSQQPQTKLKLFWWKTTHSEVSKCRSNCCINGSTFLYYGTLCFTHVHQVLFVNCDHVRLWFVFFFSLTFERKFRGCSLLFYVQKHPLYSCAGLDFLFNIFVCSLLDQEYKLQSGQFAASFWLCVLILVFCCPNFFTADAKYAVLCQQMQIVKVGATPAWIKLSVDYPSSVKEMHCHCNVSLMA